MSILPLLTFVQIGEWTLRHTCEEFEALTREVTGGESIGLSVNPSTRQLSDPFLVDTVRSALTNSGLKATRPTLEVTESTIMASVANTFRVLTELRSMGVKIAIDDFGTGYSSLSLLSEIPVDTLKTDRVFITDVAKRPDRARLVRATLRVA